MALPMKVLESFLNQRVSLLLKDNRELIGKFVGYDDYMNMVLQDAEEIGPETVSWVPWCLEERRL